MVEHHVANVRVVSSNLITRYKSLEILKLKEVNVSNQEADLNTQLFENEHLKVIVTHQLHCLVKFDITVSNKAVSASHHKAQKNVTKEISIPGFRKGKAPHHLITDRYASAIKKEFVDIVLQTAFNEAIQLTSFHPLPNGYMNRPSVQECSVEKGAHFTLEFETKPTVPKINLADLNLSKVKVKPITDKEHAHAFEQVLMQLTTFEPTKKEEVEIEDFVDLSLVTLEDPPRQIFDNQRTKVNSLSVPKWVREKIIGLKAGQSVETLTEYEGSNQEEQQSFKAVGVCLTVKGIHKGTVPPIDDELAKKVGLQTIEELHNKINERLEQEARHEANQKEMEQVENALLTHYSFDLPKTYIENDKKTRLENYKQQKEVLHQKESSESSDKKQLELFIEKISIRQLQLFFLFNKIATDHKLEVTETEVSQELMQQVQLMQNGKAEIDIASPKDKLFEQLKQIALYRKVKDFVIQNSQKENFQQEH